MFGFAFMPGGFAAIDGFATAGLVSVFVDEGGVPSPGFAIVLPAVALSRGVGTFALGVTVSARPGFDPGGAVVGFSSPLPPPHLCMPVRVVRRFPPPRSVEETDACFIVRGHAGQALGPIQQCSRTAAPDHLVLADRLGAKCNQSI
jgi:hypothetical protein